MSVNKPTVSIDTGSLSSTPTDATSTTNPVHFFVDPVVAQDLRTRNKISTLVLGALMATDESGKRTGITLARGTELVLSGETFTREAWAIVFGARPYPVQTQKRVVYATKLSSPALSLPSGVNSQYFSAQILSKQTNQDARHSIQIVEAFAEPGNAAVAAIQDIRLSGIITYGSTVGSDNKRSVSIDLGFAVDSNATATVAAGYYGALVEIVEFFPSDIGVDNFS